MITYLEFLFATVGSFHEQNALCNTSVPEQTTAGGSLSGHRRLLPDQDDVSQDGARSTSPKSDFYLVFLLCEQTILNMIRPLTAAEL